MVSISCFIKAEQDTLDLHLASLDDNAKLNYLFNEANRLQYADAEAYLKLSERAKAIAIAGSDSAGLAKAILFIGFYHLDKSEFKKSLGYFLQSLSINEKIHNKKGVGNSLFSLGNLYYYLNEPEVALKYYSRSFPIYKELEDTRGLALVSNAIGVIYMDQEQHKLAVEYFGSALNYYEDLNDQVSQGQVLTNMSYVYSQTKDYKKALDMALKGVDIARKLDDKIGAAKGLVSVGEIYTATKSWKEAQETFEESLIIAEKEGDRNLMRMIFEALSGMSKSKGDYKQALLFFEKGIHVKDSIFSQETTNQILELQTKYETDKKEKEIQLLVKDKERDQLIKAAFIGGLSLLALLSFYMFRNYRIKRKANEILTTKNIIIEEKSKNIQDSINYAKRIQEAILPSIDEISASFKDHFILYKPKDVVSGDFYAFAKKNDKLIVAAVDCTGHGVPGAFMSMIGTDKINHIVIEQGITNPFEILNQLNKGIKTALKQKDADGGESRDGMDLALCSFDLKNKKIQYAGAHRPLYHVNRSLNIIDPDKMAIGGWTDEGYSFRNNEIDVSENDCIYLFSDGYADQFGGPKQKKFTTKRFKELLLSIHHLPMDEQRLKLNDTIEEWRGELEQVDDILVIGVRI